jgi:hypothetical protein
MPKHIGTTREVSGDDLRLVLQLERVPCLPQLIYRGSIRFNFEKSVFDVIAFDLQRSHLTVK